jgi:hypothetical protein
MYSPSEPAIDCQVFGVFKTKPISRSGCVDFFNSNQRSEIHAAPFAALDAAENSC